MEEVAVLLIMMTSIEREIDKKERMLYQEEKGDNNPRTIARLKVEIAELTLDEEETKPSPNEKRIARLKAKIVKLEAKEESYAETNKGAESSLAS